MRCRLDLIGGGPPVPRQRFDFVLLTLLDICRWIAGNKLRPLVAEFTHPDPIAVKPYEDAFQCPLHFNAAKCRLLFAMADLTSPLPTSNPAMAELHERYMGEYLDRLDNAKISYKVRELIARRLPDGDPSRSDVARELCMSERTLQRRLQEEGTSFHQLVDDMRRELAQQYLKQQITLAQAAYLLGFADQSIFCRACKRWFDMSPKQYRASLGRI